MLFNSAIFLLFFLFVYSVYWQLSQHNKRIWLIIASSFFYAWWDFSFYFHFLALIIINYFALLCISKKKNKIVFFLTLALNLGNLILFKYFSSLFALFGVLTGINEILDLQNKFTIILPLAISFYTFQMTALLIDVWRNDVNKKINIIDYTLFIIFFPQLISGPIMRYRDFFHQIYLISFKESRMLKGVVLFLFGLLKKIVIADGLSVIVDPIYSAPDKFNMVSALIAIIAFPLQIYADFSGYTDMARGAAKMLGYEIPENFQAPYFACSFREFWRRWHITLSTWLRDYLYIPLGGNRSGTPSRLYFNLLITMVLGGLWHGHDYTFIFWGLLNGLYLILERVLGIGNRKYSLPGKITGGFIVFSLWSFSLIFFRSPDIETVHKLLSALTRIDFSLPINIEPFIGLFLLSLLVHILQFYRHSFSNISRFQLIITGMFFTLVSYLVFLETNREALEFKFIYFRF